MDFLQAPSVGALIIAIGIDIKGARLTVPAANTKQVGRGSVARRVVG